MIFPRRSGVLLHATSLPGPYGIGELGAEARKFADALQRMGQHLWQFLPLNPTSFGDSPYQSPSTFAGNHLLISFDDLKSDGLLKQGDLKDFPTFSYGQIDYGPVITARTAVLGRVATLFKRRASVELYHEFEAYCSREAHWLDDFSLFCALKEHFGGGPWMHVWPVNLATRDPQSLKTARRKHASAIRKTAILQFLFERQWQALRQYCHEKEIGLIGDIPIFVAHDSADVWANRELFYLDKQGQLLVQAGVPPDYFSATGQLWGNPLYKWDEHKKTGYAWWILRMQRILEQVDIVRIDHFRGFEGYWEVPGHAETAAKGRWVSGPGAELFDSLQTAFACELPIIAEDLGLITDEVDALRDQFNFPGMRVLQFSFGGPEETLNFPENSIAYTGTHDNDTAVGWFHRVPGEDSTEAEEHIKKEKIAVQKCLGSDGEEIHWDMIQAALQSASCVAVAPLQDLLGLDSAARMNRPGIAGGNWGWRFETDALTVEIEQRMLELTCRSNRCG